MCGLKSAACSVDVLETTICALSATADAGLSFPTGQSGLRSWSAQAPSSGVACLQQVAYKQGGQPALVVPAAHEGVALHDAPRSRKRQRQRQLSGRLRQHACSQ